MPWFRLARNLGVAGVVLGASACVDNLTPAPLAAYDAGGPSVGSCVPNLDGRIDAHELQAAIGIPAGFRVSAKGAARKVDIAGGIDSQGHRTWDWSASAASDQQAAFTAVLPAKRWYAQQFATGQFAVAMDAGGAVEAVYRQDQEALWLLGIASTDPAPASGKTLLVYTQPVALYRFPLQAGGQWTSVGKIQGGVLYGLPYAGTDTYVTQVDGAGVLELPDLTLTQAHRVRTAVTVVPIVGKATSRKQVSFLFECLGEVARATSQPDEKEADFTTAAEVRRLAL